MITIKLIAVDQELHAASGTRVSPKLLCAKRKNYEEARAKAVELLFNFGLPEF